MINPTVSIIVPTYNRASYVKEAIRSALVQTFPDLEVIIVDDGSTDNTFEVVKRFNDPRIRFIYQPNSGRSTARNRGMEAARGEYIALLDDDDLFLPEKLDKQISYLESHKDIDLVAVGARIIDGQGNPTGIIFPWENQPELTLKNCLYACPLLTCSVVFRRKSLECLDHWFDKNISLGEDKDFFLRMLIAGCRMSWIKEILCLYRIHQRNSQQDAERYNQARIKLLDKIFNLPNLPVPIFSERNHLYAHYYLHGACHAYATGQVVEAKNALQQAFLFEPELASEELSTFAAFIAGFAGTFHVDNADEFIESVFRNIPEKYQHLRKTRRKALSVYRMKKIFGSPSLEQRPHLSAWVSGVWYDPGWLKNRGVWSILFKQILLAREKSSAI
jgi:glycosyltransferase involved in cell wall biosynthesis